MTNYNKTIITNYGKAKFESISVSEFGFVQLKLFLIEDKVYRTITIDKIENILSKLEFKIEE